MKKNGLYLLIIIMLSACWLTSCSSPFLQEQNPAETSENQDFQSTGTLSVKFKIPRYRGLTWDLNRRGSRVIDPQTAFVQIYLSEQLFFDLALSAGTYTESSLFIDAQWEKKLTVLPTLYPTVRVVLTDADHVPLTEGTACNVNVPRGEITTVSIGCLPVNFQVIPGNGTPLTGNAANGTVTYFNFTGLAGNVYQIDLSAGSGTPDLYVFGSNGALLGYTYNTGALTSLVFTISTGGPHYIGVHAFSADTTFNLSLSVLNYGVLINTATDLAGYTGDAITFDASGSSDPDGSIVSWEWDFGDSASGSGAVTTHSYSTAGIYTTLLTVTDDYGSRVTLEINVTVLDDVGIYYPVINEVAFSLGSAVELYNPSLTIFDLNGWTLSWDNGFEANSYTFTSPVELSPGKYLVIIPEDNLSFYIDDPFFDYLAINTSFYFSGYNATTLALLNDAGTGVDFVAMNTDEFNQPSPPAGTTWDYSGGHLQVTLENLSRVVPLADTNSPDDWLNHYETLGLANDIRMSVDIQILCF